jgi:two-component system, OmpR family, phosphate regulon sensor histidine kinase PhoR
MRSSGGDLDTSRPMTEASDDLRTLTEALGVGIIRLDRSLVIRSANPAAHLFAGRRAGGLVGRSLIEAFIDRRIEELAESARSAGSATAELALRTADGPTLMIRARPAADGSGLWLILEDVSELRRLQRIRSEFVDNLSHELRTPLTNISLLAETLVREAEAAGEKIPVRMRDRIGRIEVETGHLVQMVSELLDLARIESGRPMPLIDRVDLGRLAVATTERLRLFAERQGVRLAIDLPAEGVPPVRGAEEQLGQVILNLVHNAVKFSPDGGDVTLRVTTGPGPAAEPADGTPREVVVSVEDHGIGIPRGSQSRVFERFYKVDRARVRGGGTGLGLSIVRHVIEGHGGRIWVESEEGRGSTFSFALPVADEQGTAE